MLVGHSMGGALALLSTAAGTVTRDAGRCGHHRHRHELVQRRARRAAAGGAVRGVRVVRTVTSKLGYWAGTPAVLRRAPAQHGDARLGVRGESTAGSGCTATHSTTRHRPPPAARRPAAERGRRRGRWRAFHARRNGPITAHCSSVRSLGYAAGSPMINPRPRPHRLRPPLTSARSDQPTMDRA